VPPTRRAATAFPRNRLEPGEYALAARAVGYDIDSPAKATVAAEKAATADIKLKKDQESRRSADQRRVDDEHPRHRGSESTAAQLRRRHTWSASCASTHDSDEWTKVVIRMRGYGA